MPRKRYNPRTDDPSREELQGKANLEKNDFIALVIAATTVFLPIILLFVGFLLLLVYLLF